MDMNTNNIKIVATAVVAVATLLIKPKKAK